MEYVEILRARRVLFWYTLALVFALAITAASMLSGHAQMHGDRPHPFDVADGFLGAAMGAFVIATCVGRGLIAEAGTLPITWTRPVPRAQIAWRFIAVDVAAIVAGYLILIAIMTGFITLFGILGLARLGPDALPKFALALGAGVMWYALIALAASRLPGRGGLIAGLSWVAFLVVGSLWDAPFPVPLHALLTAFNYLNPMAYIDGIKGPGGTHPITLAENVRIVAVWAIAAVALAGTVRLWSTREI